MDPALSTAATRSTALLTHRVQDPAVSHERPVFLMDANVNTVYPFLETAAEVEKASEALATYADE